MSVNELLFQIDNADFLEAEQLANLTGIDLTDADPQVFINGLSHEKDVIRYVSVKVLGMIAASETKELETASTKGLESGKKLESIKELKSVNDLTLQLTKMLASDPDDDVKAAVAETLGLINDRLAVPSLIKALDDKCYLVCRYAIKSLGLIGGDDAITALIQTSKSDDYDMRIWSASTLKRLVEIIG
jgi:hypothetical protein